MPDTDTLTLPQLPFYQKAIAPPTADTLEVDLGLPLDSIFRPCDRPEPLQRKSLFTHHSMPLQHHELQERHDAGSPAWIFVLLLALTVLVFLFNNIHKIKPSTLLKATIDRRAMDRLVRDSNLIRPAQMMPVALLLVAELGMVAYMAAMRHMGVSSYLLVTAALAVGYLLRNSLLRLLGNVFDSKEAVAAYITNSYIFHLVLAVALLPLLFLMAYMPWGAEATLYAAIGITALTFLVRVTRCLNLFLTISKTLRFYLFYYLCTVEIVPVLVLIKLIID